MKIAIGVGLALALLLAPSVGAAQSASQAEMAGHMQDWFDGERSESYVFLGAGVISLGGGIYLATRDDEMARGAGYTTAAVGGLLTLFAITYTLSLSPKHDELKTELADDPAAYKREETKRMEDIADRFVIYRWAEVGVLAAGAGLIGYGLLEDHDLLTGIGTALAGEAALLLVLDYFAERRAHTYLDHLREFDPTGSSTSPVARSGFAIGFGGAF